MKIFGSSITKISKLLLSVFLTSLCSLASSAIGCEVTNPLTKPIDGPSLNHSDYTWYGDEEFAVLLPNSGEWGFLGNKFWLWREGYRVDLEPKPNIEVWAKNTPAFDSLLVSRNPTNAKGTYWDAMLVGIVFPARGCWDVHVKYNEEVVIKFTLLVELKEESRGSA